MEAYVFDNPTYFLSKKQRRRALKSVKKKTHRETNCKSKRCHDGSKFLNQEYQKFLLGRTEQKLVQQHFSNWAQELRQTEIN